MKQVLTATQGRPSSRTVVHWVLVVLLSLSGLLTTATGIYFLFLPSGGYQGGRNPNYGETFLFDRAIWTDIHTWAGIVLIAVSVVHVVLHWHWVAEMWRRVLAVVLGRRKQFNRKIWARIGVVTVVGLVFVGAAVSGIYFFVVPGGHGSGSATQFLFARNTWDLIHTWSGVLMIVAAMLHLTMRWKWVARVTPGVLSMIVARKDSLPEGVTTCSSAS
jgi:hypothetical protein